MTFGRLTRKDLASFDQRAQDLILTAIEQGCTARISTKRHCILRNNNGDTASVPRNLVSSNRSSLNVRAEVRRLLAAHRPARKDAPASKATVGRPAQITVAQAFADHGAAFSCWLDERGIGLSPEAVIEIRLDESGEATFESIASPTQTLESSPMSSTARADAEPPATDDSATLRRIRQALGEDPRIAELRAEVARLTAERDREKRRADQAETRITLLREALDA